MKRTNVSLSCSKSILFIYSHVNIDMADLTIDYISLYDIYITIFDRFFSSTNLNGAEQS